MPHVHHRYRTVRGHRLFYREAGPADAPTVVLLHGFPTSSFMFRDLVPRLATRYRVIAPDLLGFGLSDAPPVAGFDYTFDALTDLTEELLRELGVQRFAMYVQDYGAPIGWRLALRQPDAITAIVSQNGNAYDAGFVTDFWTTVWDYQREQTSETESAIRQALTLDVTRWQYLTGVPDESLVSPEAWQHDVALLSRAGNDEIQLALFRDYASNPPMYPKLHDYLRASRVPVLAVWGRGDQIFGPAGAEAFRDDAVDPEIHLLDGGHFLLESAVDEVSDLITDFLARRLPRQGADSSPGGGGAPTSALEVVTVPVDDVDRSLAFYRDQAGFVLDVDYRPSPDFRVVQLTPPGSATSIHLEHDPARAGILAGTVLVVADVETEACVLRERGVAVSDLRHKSTAGGATGGGWRGSYEQGPDPERGDYATFADFTDPDGNGWVLQERRYRPAGSAPR